MLDEVELEDSDEEDKDLGDLDLDDDEHDEIKLDFDEDSDDEGRERVGPRTGTYPWQSGLQTVGILEIVGTGVGARVWSSVVGNGVGGHISTVDSHPPLAQMSPSAVVISHEISDG